MKHLAGIFLLAIIMIALPIHLRLAHNNPTIAGTEPYYHARMAMQLSKLNFEDNSILNGRQYKINPYDFVLAIGYKLIGPITFKLFPAIFAFAGFLFFWLLLRKLNIAENMQSWMLLAYALSPPLMTIGIIGTPQAFVLALLTAGSILLLSRWWTIGTAFFLIASLSGRIYNIAAIVFLIFFMLAIKRTNQLKLTTLLSAVILVIGYTPPSIEKQTAISQYISDFGGVYGLSIFALLLAIVGAVLVWEHKKAYYGAYALIIITLIASYFLPDLLVFSNTIISALAGIALAKLSQRKWDLNFLRHAALLVLFCGLLFSSIAHAVSLADTPPTKSFFKALEFPPGIILSHEQYGFWIEMAGHKAVLDQLWKELPNPEEQKWDVAALFSLAELEKAKPLLAKYNITHILITSEMQHGLLWAREDEGLDFLVENSEMFKKQQTGSNIGIWKVK